MNFKKFRKFKKLILQFKMQNNQLFKRNIKNIFLRRIIDDLVKRQKIIIGFHDEVNHKKNVSKNYRSLLINAKFM